MRSHIVASTDTNMLLFKIRVALLALSAQVLLELKHSGHFYILGTIFILGLVALAPKLTAISYYKFPKNKIHNKSSI